jgi:hypothetical protein
MADNHLVSHPARNRVTPLGDIEAFALRGAWTGNRGKLHRGHEIVRPYASKLWIVCALKFRGRWREQWQPNRYTFLYFHDEAVAFAAGHRPCAVSRRAAYNAFRNAWSAELGGDVPSAAVMNEQLHSERLVPGSRRRRVCPVPWRNLPDGAFVQFDDEPHLVLGDHLVRWKRTGYAMGSRRPVNGLAIAITPPSTLGALRGGYPLQIDDAAFGFAK